MSRGAPRWWQMLALAAPTLPLSLFIAPFPAFLAAFYAKYTAASASGIATALLLIRVVDAVVDPLIGIASDRTHGVLGPRKPWIIVGGVLATAALLVHLRPPRDAGVLYFAGGAILYYAARALIDIPLTAWAGEISPHYRDRSRVAALNTLGLLVGGTLLLLLPEILTLPSIALAKSSALDPPMMAIFAVIGAVLLPPCIAIAVAFAPAAAAAPSGGLASLRQAVAGNRPYHLFLAADACTQFAWGVSYALMFIVLDAYFGMGERVALIIVIATAAQILAIPVSAALAGRFGKHVVWSAATLAGAALGPAILLFPPHGQADFASFGAFVFITNALGAPNMMFPTALIGDIADFAALRTGARDNASLVAFRLLEYKIAFAVGSAAGLYLMAAGGFDPKSAHNTQGAMWNLLAAAAVLPSLLFLVSGLLLARYPITKRRHAAIARRLARRAAARETGGSYAADRHAGPKISKQHATSSNHP